MAIKNRIKESEERNSHKLNALKIAVPILLLLIIAPMISKAATLTDTFKFGLEDIDIFLNDKDNRYLTIIDFLFFSLLFISVYLIGAKYAFKELKRPERTIVILLGIMTAYLLVLADISVTYLLPYVHYIFYFLLFLLYWWMLKGLKSKFWRFVLALLLTALTIWLLSGLIEGLTGGQAGVPKVGGIGGIFSSLGNAFSGIKLPSVSAPQLPSITPPQPGQPGGVTGTPTPPEVLKTQSGLTKFAKDNWWILAAIASLLIILLFSSKGLSKFKKWREDRKKQKSIITPESLTVEAILKRLEEIIEIKKEVLERISEILKRKKELGDVLRDNYFKAVRKIRDPSFLRDPESKEFKDFVEEHGTIAELLKIEMEIEELLKKLINEENKLTGTKEKGGEITDWVRLLIPRYQNKTDELEILLASLQHRPNMYLSTGQPDTQFWKSFWDKIISIVKNTPTTVRTSGTYFSSKNPLEHVPDWYIINVRKLFEMFENLQGGTLEKTREMAVRYFLLSKEDVEAEQMLKSLTEVTKVNLYVDNYEKWKEIQSKYESKIEELFKKEKEFFGTPHPMKIDPNNPPKMEFGPFSSAIIIQMNVMKYIKALIEILEEKRPWSLTKMQELVVLRKKSIIDDWLGSEEITEKAWRDAEDITEEATDSTRGVPYTAEIAIKSNFVSGEPPFRISAYNLVTEKEITSDGKIKVRRVLEKRGAFSKVFPFSEKSLLFKVSPLSKVSQRKTAVPGAVFFKGRELNIQPGQNDIYVVAVSQKDTGKDGTERGFKRGDKKSITIYVVGAGPTHAPGHAPGYGPTHTPSSGPTHPGAGAGRGAGAGGAHAPGGAGAGRGAGAGGAYTPGGAGATHLGAGATHSTSHTTEHAPSEGPKTDESLSHEKTTSEGDSRMNKDDFKKMIEDLLEETKGMEEGFPDVEEFKI